MDVFDALEQQEERLDAILSSLDEKHWEVESLCPGWTVRDVVLHLAQTEEAVLAALEGRTAPIPVQSATTIDEAMEAWVRSERNADPHTVRARWDRARRAALRALRTADPDRAVAWAAAPLKPRTLATTRLAEHWIHTLDIADPLRIEQPDGDHLRDIAWLAYRSLGYAFERAGRGAPPTVRLELDSPAGESWVFGPENADCLIRGPAGQFCRVAARRLEARAAPDLHATGTQCTEVLELVRTYA
ncbi:MAG: maleylpyruvate isomerase family mycothiol-dependent enzyme [Actinomycetota bacterium]|nr:maleylpyruvate isomerase family mycothiol-dependent enzyme [Actinomycetota bacterium]